MGQKVAIFGGGIAGMSAAHELIRRGFEVDVYEKLTIPGGKARSMPVPGSATDGRKPLPGEHGFRFFPGFYRHITATMKEIPINRCKSAFDNLTDTTRIGMARDAQEMIVLPAGFPRNYQDVKVILKLLFDTHTGIPDDEIAYFTERVWQIISSCSARRMNEYEQMGWWEFIGADTRSKAYQNLLGYGLTRSLVAAQANLASTRTVGHILVLLLLDLLQPGLSCDRVLNGPTNEVWIDPWRTYLESKGVRYHIDSEATAIHCQDETIQSVSVSHQGVVTEIHADYYLMAVPVERMANLINQDLLKADPCLIDIQELGYYPNLSAPDLPGSPFGKNYLGWMNGSQFYLYDDVPLIRGHVIYTDSPWALTSISQKQFWPTLNLGAYGDGQVKGILSIDISEWDKPGILYHKHAKHCTRQQVLDEVWAQLKQALNVNGQEVLKDSNLHSSFLDPDIVFEPPQADHSHNNQPLLVNLVNSWTLRPNAYTRISNLFLASDYVKTNTDLATMEGANEAARRAVNSIIDASGVRARYCRIWTMNEPYMFKIWRWVDARRYGKGLVWRKEMPGWSTALQTLLLLVIGIPTWTVNWIRGRWGKLLRWLKSVLCACLRLG